MPEHKSRNLPVYIILPKESYKKSKNHTKTET